ncbi:PulJ/GspJ family protein [Fundidesulfovibrio terrae]|uniref:PulJ/GspJ family protein n=1 Tax=Fundidesulfovibrio terrae TaxID=2922866 RepID=UPI001FAE75FB|nr:type II secretion system protein [Fundidesulfovibrio terrae]
MKKERISERGATLLEVIITLVILSMVAAGSLAILFNIVEGMIQERNVSAAEENIQGALTRITHEIANMDTKRAYTFAASSITYYYRTDATQSTIQLSGTNLQLNGNTLLNNVVSGTGFAVTAPNYTTSPAVPVGISLSVQVKGARITVTKTYTAKIELNTQRFQ